MSGTYEFYTIAEDGADDLSTVDMADGSAGDAGVGNIETKTPHQKQVLSISYL